MKVPKSVFIASSMEGGTSSGSPPLIGTSPSDVTAIGISEKRPTSWRSETIHHGKKATA